MKKFKASLILVAMGIVFSIGIMAQPPKPPADHGTLGNQPPAGPSGVPIDPGTGILLIFAAAYGIKNVYFLRKKTEI